MTRKFSLTNAPKNLNPPFGIFYVIYAIFAVVTRQMGANYRVVQGRAPRPQ